MDQMMRIKFPGIVKCSGVLRLSLRKIDGFATLGPLT